MTNHRVINVQPGIGDNIWLLQKLINQPEKFFFHLPSGKPQRGAQIFDVCPQVSAGAKYVDGLTYRKIEANNTQREIPSFHKIKYRRLWLSMNGHLEAGKRIEEFFPDLKTSFQIDWYTEEEHKGKAASIVLPDLTNLTKRYIGIYCSAYSTGRAWGFWDEAGWLELIKSLNMALKDVTFVFIGADWDIDLTHNVMRACLDNNIKVVNAVGADLPVTIEVMKLLDYFIGFPSGMSILNATLGRPGLMFYPPHLEKMMYAWADPEMIEKKTYLPMLFTDSKTVFNKIIPIISSLC